jgi:hypothetical protein
MCYSHQWRKMCPGNVNHSRRVQWYYKGVASLFRPCRHMCGLLFRPYSDPDPAATSVDSFLQLFTHVDIKNLFYPNLGTINSRPGTCVSWPVTWPLSKAAGRPVLHNVIHVQRVGYTQCFIQQYFSAIICTIGCKIKICIVIAMCLRLESLLYSVLRSFATALLEALLYPRFNPWDIISGGRLPISHVFASRGAIYECYICQAPAFEILKEKWCPRTCTC